MFPPRKSLIGLGIPSRFGAENPMSKTNECPYGADSCPKIEDLEKEVQSTKDLILRLLKVVYLIAGILTINLGITIV